MKRFPFLEAEVKTMSRKKFDEAWMSFDGNCMLEMYTHLVTELFKGGKK